MCFINLININKPKRAYFSKLYTTISIVFLTITVFLVAFFYSYNYRLIARERYLTNTSKVHKYSESMDIKLQAVTAQIEKYRNQQNFISFAMSDSFYDSNINEIYNQLEENRFLFDTLRVAVGVIHPKMNVSLLTGYFNKLDLTSLVIPYENLSLNYYTFMETNGVIPIIGENAKPGMMYVINQRYQGEHQLIFLMVVYNTDNDIVSKNENYFVVSSNRIVLQAAQAPTVDKITDYISGGAHEKNDMSFYVKNSTIIPTLKYVYYHNENTANFLFIFQIIVMLISLITLSLWLAYIMSKRLYGPIGDVVSSFQKINTDDFSDEVKYVTDTANRMLKSLNELTEKSKRQISIIKTKFIYDLCIGIVTKNDAQKYIEEYSLKLLNQNHVIILFEISNFVEITEHYDSETYKSIKNDLIEMFLDVTNGRVCYVFEPEHNRFAFIIDDDIKETIKKINEISSSIEFADDISIIAAVSGVATDFTQTENLYHDAVYILDNCFFAGGTYVYTMDNVSQKQNSGLYYPIEIERQIIESMTNSKQSNAISLIEKILDYNLSEGLTKQRQTELKFLLISTINRILGQINQSIDAFFGDGTVLYLELSADNDTDFKEKVIDIFKKLGENLPNEDGSDNAKLKRIVEFIDSNIDKDISLMDLSDYLKLSTWYVSKLFKTIVKQNFKSYVNQRRVEVAKKILIEEPEAMIRDIAVRVGCNNTVTFNRTFKKYTGMSPSEFRQNLF